MKMTDTPTLSTPITPIKTRVAVEINGQLVTQEVTPRTHLGDFLRDQVKLTGTHLGCEHGVCGACVVLLDGKPVRSCITYAAACDGHTVTTIEGYESDPVMARLRKAFTEHHALQCGYCTPGMLTTSRDIVLRLPDADERHVRAELSGNLCRCTGYVGIVGAVMSVLTDLKQHDDPEIEKLRVMVKAGHSASLAPTNLSATFVTFEAAPMPSVSHEHSASNDTRQTDTTTSASPSTSPSGTLIQETVDLPFHADQVWQLMIDLPSVARCLPGATVNEMVGDKVNGTVSVKFGPMKASFDGHATLERDDTRRLATLAGTGRDRLSQSQANGRVSYRLEATSAQATRVHIRMEYTLQGPLAQFSRSGMVQEFVRRLIQDFAKNVSHVLAHPESSTTLTMPSKEISAIAMLWGIWMDKLRRLLGINKTP